jgi:hypothetical protein
MARGHEASAGPVTIMGAMDENLYLRCQVCGWTHAAVPPGEPAGTRCFRCGGARFAESDYAAIVAAGIPPGVTVQPLTWPLPVEEPDETNGFGRYHPDHEPDAEEELYAVIFALVRQGCATQDPDKLDSWAISAYERAIETLAEAGLVAIDTEGRIGATVLPAGRNFEAWMDHHERCKRIREAKRRVDDDPDMTVARAARLYDITVEELSHNPGMMAAMTKVVYNDCYGGFSLSEAAIARYKKIKGAVLGDFDHRYDIERDDPALVQVVEELGKTANGEFADLQIEEVPKGTQWRIDGYGGKEFIATKDSYDWKTA